MIKLWISSKYIAALTFIITKRVRCNKSTIQCVKHGIFFKRDYKQLKVKTIITGNNNSVFMYKFFIQNNLCLTNILNEYISNITIQIKMPWINNLFLGQINKPNGSINKTRTSFDNIFYYNFFFLKILLKGKHTIMPFFLLRIDILKKRHYSILMNNYI